jgi:hypothetical protein
MYHFVSKNYKNCLLLSCDALSLLQTLFQNVIYCNACISELYTELNEVQIERKNFWELEVTAASDTHKIFWNWSIIKFLVRIWKFFIHTDISDDNN